MTTAATAGVRYGRIGIVLIGLLLVVGILYAALSTDDPEPLYAYSELLADASAGRVEAIEQEGTTLYVYFADGQPRTTHIASSSINVYAEICSATGAPVGPDCPIFYAVLPDDQADEWVGLLISALLPVFLIGVFFYFMMRQAQKTSSPSS